MMTTTEYREFIGQNSNTFSKEDDTLLLAFRSELRMRQISTDCRIHLIKVFEIRDLYIDDLNRNFLIREKS